MRRRKGESGKEAKWERGKRMRKGGKGKGKG